jgi:hypothetical protein
MIVVVATALIKHYTALLELYRKRADMVCATGHVPTMIGSGCSLQGVAQRSEDRRKHLDGMPWWGALLIFFAPDLSFLGYLLGPGAGALCYNAVHIYAFGAASLAIGLIMPIPLLVVPGALWLAHSGFDRMLGYGLKSPEGFAFTHLGRIGKQP